MAHPIISELRQLIPRFCRLNFDSDARLSELGDALPLDERGREVVKPRKLSADRCELEHSDLPFADRFLTTLNFTWEHSETIRLDDLEQCFGPCRVSRGTALVGPTYYMFQIDDQPLSALLRFTMEAEARSDQLAFRHVSLRRMPPAPQAIESKPAVRFVILADFHATEDISDRVPLPTILRSAEELSEVIARQQPMVVLNVANHLDRSRPELHLHFHLSSLDDFQLENLLRSIPGGAAVLKLRHRIAGAHAGKRSWDTIRDALEDEELPLPWRRRGEALLTNPETLVGELLREIDRALSAQCDAVLGNPEFQAFQSVWLGLDYLVQQVDFSSGSWLEVFSADSHWMLDVMQRGFVVPEKRHHAGPIPVLVIADTELGPDSVDKCRSWSMLAESVRVPVFLSGAVSLDVNRHRLGDAAREGYLASVGDQICVRSRCGENSARYFSYQPSADSSRTECWASGVWGIGALAAHGLSRSGRLNVGDSIAPPPMSDANLPWVRGDSSLRAGNEQYFTRLECNAPEGRGYVSRLRGIAEGPEVAAGLPAKMVLSPILQFAQRWRHQHAHRRDFSNLTESFTATATRRFPATIIKAEFRRLPAEHLLVRVTPTLAIGDTKLTFQLVVPWGED
jgi:hypothetical protein